MEDTGNEGTRKAPLEEVARLREEQGLKAGQDPVDAQGRRVVASQPRDLKYSVIGGNVVMEPTADDPDGKAAADERAQEHTAQLQDTMTR